jgi:hypothetical protein
MSKDQARLHDAMAALLGVSPDCIDDVRPTAYRVEVTTGDPNVHTTTRVHRVELRLTS